MITKISETAALGKALIDKPFDYAVRLRSGEVIRFEGADMIDEEWIHLDLGIRPQPVGCGLPYPAERGIDVRVSEIVWFMDAPEGS